MITGRKTSIAAAILVIAALCYFTLIPQFLILGAVTLWSKGFTEVGYKSLGNLAYALRRSFEPLPGDEEMVRHFHAHRAEIEELIQTYRSYRPKPEGKFLYWGDVPETKSLRERSGVDSVDGSLIGGPWLPDPYSPATAERAHKRTKSMDIGTEERLYGTIIVRLAPNDSYFSPSGRYGIVMKEFLYFPEVPRIVGGELWWPVDRAGKPGRKVQVADTLDHYPEKFDRGSCALRRIEAQWFLSLCRG